MIHHPLPYARSGEWLELETAELLRCAADAGKPTPTIGAGSHPHHARIWLLALGLFPEKWLNRLFSVGDLRMDGDKVLLRTFVPGEPERDEAYRLALVERKDAAEENARNDFRQYGANDSRPNAAGSSALMADVLFMDEWCLVMNKPAGMPVHASAPGQRGTLDEVAARVSLANGDGLPAKHIHRLDDDTAGPVLYARNELAQLRLDEAMREKTIGRQYAAIVHGKPRLRRGTIDAPIGKDRHHRSRRRITPDGDQAITHYETIDSYRDASLVRLWLETGRTHQIRVHMSHLGHPLVGDALYGGSDAVLRHQALRGEQLSFVHPWSGAETTVVSPEPPWFAEVRKRLSSL